MFLVNFSHPITNEQKSQLETLTGEKVDHILDCQAPYFTPDQSFSIQTRDLINQVNLTAKEWQTNPILVNLPAFSVIAALILAELHGKMGHFPSIIRLREAENSTHARYEIAEVINLQNIRNSARSTRIE